MLLISIVDDNRSVRRAVRRLVQSAGYAAEAFASTREFLDSPASTRSACLVLDIYLEGTNGFDLQAQMAAAGSPVPIIFITAHDDAATRERIQRSSAVTYLSKPFDDQALLEAIHRAVGDDGPQMDQGPISPLPVGV